MTDLASIAQACGRARKVSRGYVCLCPAHCDRTPSLQITRGQRVPLLVKCFAGCDAADVLDALEAKGFRVRKRKEAATDPLQRTAPPPPVPENDDAQARRCEAALRIWHDAGPVKGTLAEVYLAGRGL